MWSSRLRGHVSGNNSHRIFLAAALLIAAVAALPLFMGNGLLNTRGGGDSPFLLQRVHQLASAVSDGHFPVRWMPDANYGYGYPFYNFYAPLSIYVSAAFRFLGFDYVTTVQLTQLLGFLLAAWGMFQLGFRWLGTYWAGLLAAVAYTLAPFHLVNVYVRGDSLAEFWAMAFFPLVILSLDALVQARSDNKSRGWKRYFLLLALSYAGLVLSHNISALIFTPFILLYLVILALGSAAKRESIRQLMWPLLALALGLALSAWFWVPALVEQSLAQLGPVTSGYFSFGNHFRGADLVQRSILFDFDVAGGRAFRMGLVQATAILLGLLVLLAWNGNQKRPEAVSDRGAEVASASGPVTVTVRLFIVIGLLIATFMITPLSRPLWNNLQLLPFVQFPWRFLSVQAFFGALAIAALALLPRRRILVPSFGLLLLVAGLSALQTDFLVLSDADVTAERLGEYEWYTGNIGTTVSAEYLPPYVQPRPQTSGWINNGIRDSPKAIEGTLSSARLNDRRATAQSWQLDVPSPGATITLPTMYWAGWKAEIGGVPVEIEPAAGSGLISLEVPPGEHEVTLRLTRTPIRLFAELFSFATILATFWFSRNTISWKPRRLHLVVMAGLAVLFILLRLLPQQPSPDDDLTWDFEQLAYLHHSQEGASFEGGAQLSRYTYSTDEVETGATVTVTLTWEAAGSGPATLAIVSPAINRFKEIRPIATQTHPVEPGETVYRFSIPDNAPAGLYVPRLSLGEARPLTSSGLTRGQLFLRPILILEQRLPAAPGQSELDARTLKVTHNRPNLLDVEMQWLTQHSLTQNYNFSLRLIDGDGDVLAQFDGQPGYGYLPSSGWAPGQWVNDWLSLALPAAWPPTDLVNPIALVVHLYDVETGTTVLTRRLGQLGWEEDVLSLQESAIPLRIPEDSSPATVIFDESIALRGYTSDQSNNVLKVTLYWEALADIAGDYSHFIHVVDPASGAVLSQHDAMPQNNSYPTSQWSPGEIVADPATIELEGLSAGEYLILVGLYQNLGDTQPRLPAFDPEGSQLPDNHFLLPDRLHLEP
jgi:hypothetical protein